jgi:cardiolipin synthase
MTIDQNTLLVIAFIIDVIVRVTLLFYIPRGRKPSAATAWLLAIFLLPSVIGLVLFIIIGTTKPSRLRQKRQAIINEKILASAHTLNKTKHNERIGPLVTLNQNLSKFGATAGNASSIYTDYYAMIDAIVDDVTAATSYVYIESYILSLDDVTEPLFVAMEKACDRGVNVYVLFDAFGSRKFKNTRAMKQRLTQSGIAWQKMLPITLVPGKYSRPDLRNHRKLIAIDNHVAYIGSLNLIEPRYERNDDIIYEELVARMAGPIVPHIAAIIAGDWYSETGETILHFQKTKNSVATGNQLMQIIPSGPAYKNENNLKLFLDVIYAAKQKIVITNPYLVPTEPLIVALITAAQRGVSVTIINSEAVDQWMVGHAQRSYYEQLLRAGVVIYLHTAPVLLHSKHMTIDDDIAIIGSSNMDVRSFELNYECGLAIYDGVAVRQLTAIQKINIDQSYKLTTTMWSKRSTWNQFLDSVARLTSALQ